jgi:hypothetical protein
MSVCLGGVTGLFSKFLCNVIFFPHHNPIKSLYKCNIYCTVVFYMVQNAKTRVPNSELLETPDSSRLTSTGPFCALLVRDSLAL